MKRMPHPCRDLCDRVGILTFPARTRIQGDCESQNPTSRKRRETWGTPLSLAFGPEPQFLSSPQTASISPNPHIRKHK